MNYLEQLAVEWYSFQGYFVRSNVRARKRARGGWDAELDVLAYEPKGQRLLHVELSGDSNPWQVRKSRFLTKKFIFTRAEYEDLLGFEIQTLERIAVVGYSRTSVADRKWGDGIRVVLVPEFLQVIADHIGKLGGPMRNVIPEGFPILRTVQAVAHWVRDSNACV